MTGRRPSTVGDGAAEDAIARRNEWSGRPPRLGDVTHVHRDHDPRAWHWFARGPIVAADGGRRGDDRSGGEQSDDSPAGGERDVEGEQLRDVSHEPAHGDGASSVWDRGDETEDDER